MLHRALQDVITQKHTGNENSLQIVKYCAKYYFYNKIRIELKHDPISTLSIFLCKLKIGKKENE